MQAAYTVCFSLFVCSYIWLVRRVLYSLFACECVPYVVIDTYVRSHKSSCGMPIIRVRWPAIAGLHAWKAPSARVTTVVTTRCVVDYTLSTTYYSLLLSRVYISELMPLYMAALAPSVSADQ